LSNTSAPLAAKRSATARPIPRVPPVINTRRALVAVVLMLVYR
jgi:hypothetical protein